MPFFRVWLNLSTPPIGLGVLHSRVDVFEAPFRQRKTENSVKVDCGPFSVVIVVGVPHREKRRVSPNCLAATLHPGNLHVATSVLG